MVPNLLSPPCCTATFNLTDSRSSGYSVSSGEMSGSVDNSRSASIIEVSLFSLDLRDSALGFEEAF